MDKNLNFYLLPSNAEYPGEHSFFRILAFIMMRRKTTTFTA